MGLERIDALTAGASAPAVAAATALLTEYRDHTQTIAGPGFWLAKLEREIAELPRSYDLAGEGLLIASVDGAPAGCVALRKLPEISSERACELKRLWVREAFRKSGLGARLVEAAIGQARSEGYAAVYLDTVPDAMASAYRLYLRLGFADCPPYRASDPGLRFIRRGLAA